MDYRQTLLLTSIFKHMNSVKYIPMQVKKHHRKRHLPVKRIFESVNHVHFRSSLVIRKHKLHIGSNQDNFVQQHLAHSHSPLSTRNQA